uniref:Programmed cell death protein 2 C-terminal domain-containing protein n=1 Tax=Oreochromis niloticus TaxID=8128 RepID=A0A669BNS5_ORENI
MEVALLGLCDGEIESKKQRCSYLTNKVGGRPDWPPGIAARSPRCGRCRVPLVHVVQVYCPVDTSPYHRNLHLFACPGAECSGRSECWAVLRSQCLEAEVRTPGPPALAREAPLRVTDWCDTADDWGMGGEEDDDGWGGGAKQNTPEADLSTDISSRLCDLSLGDLQEDVSTFRPFFISVVEETDVCGEDSDLEHAQDLLREYERREGVAVGELEGSGGGGDEKYEKTRARHGDAVFSRFMKTISVCPQQILRYCRSGKPLFISEPPSNVAQLVPACGSCGGSRTFELQLMPALLEFGTVLVYTCTDSCWTSGSDSAVEEFCFVQTDPDQQLFV